jgi:capsid protein
MGFISWMFGLGAKSAPIEYQLTDVSPKKTVDNIIPVENGFVFNPWDGEKFSGGFGLTEDRAIDYWTLRTRSARVYDENLFAYALVSRRVNNIIAKGLMPESEPIGKTLGWDDEKARAFGEEVERQFSVWANSPYLCDAKEERTFGQIQREIETEADVEGDVLVVLKWNNKQNLPRVDLVCGRTIQTPITEKPAEGHTITEGVERDARGRHVAYWVYKGNGKYDRLPAWGEKSGRRLAFLHYAPGKRAEDVRGQPLLSRSLQSLKEIDRYSAALQRKAVLNSMVAMTIERDVESTAAPKGVAFSSAVNGPTQVETTTASGTKALSKMQHLFPGVIVDQLQAGWKLRAHQGNAAMEPFEQFANSHLKPIAFSNGLAPEVFMMEFNKSFSAAQAANNEQRLEVNIERDRFSSSLSIIYEEWFVASVLNGKLDAPGFIDAMRDPKQYDKYVGYLGHRWAGYVKPVVDLAKIVPAYIDMLEQGLITRDRVCQELHGMDFDEVIRRCGPENLKVAAALKPLVELGLLGSPPPAPAAESQDTPTQ